MKIPAALALVLVGVTVRAEDPDREALVKQAAKVQGQVLSEFRAIKDAATAQAARKNLVRLGREGDLIKWAVFDLNLTSKDREAFQRRLDHDLAPVAEMLQKEIARASGTRDAIAILADLPVVKDAAVILERQAQDKAVALERALKTYILKNDGAPPQLLRDVGRYLTDPKGGLLDPWGQEYQFGSAEKGDLPIYYVWTVSPFGDGKKRIGSRNDKK